VGKRVQIGSTFPAPYPETFLPIGFKTGIITLTFRPQCIEPLEVQTAAVNGKPVIRGNGLVFGTAPVPFAVLPILVAARAFLSFRLPKRAAVFLAGTAIVRGFTILVHGKSRFADGIAHGEILSALCAALFERDDGFSAIDVPHCIVDAPCVIPLVGKKRTFLQGKNPVGSGENFR
jgi:hypothetical protein